MLPTSSLGRRALGAILVLTASCLSVYATRGFQKPYSPDSPSYRQKGEPDAKVVIVEFSDFQCPHCALAASVMKKVLELYGKDSRLIFKHFPLERRHDRARQAAKLTECAGRQGKFWELHDLIFEKQWEWMESKDDKLLMKYADLSNLNPTALTACLNDSQTNQVIDADIKEGNAQWVGSTPTFFINGRRFVGAKQLSSLGSLWIEKQLKQN